MRATLASPSSRFADAAVRRRRWRIAVAWAALVALAWPSLGPLPFLFHDVAPRVASAAAHQHDAADRHDDTVDASAIPGSPTHPIDHDCAECEVLKHLSRCVPTVLAIAVPAPVLAALPASRRAVVTRPRVHEHFVLPPARAPPGASRSRTSLA